jgi:hypothetical protein
LITAFYHVESVMASESEMASHTYSLRAGR